MTAIEKILSDIAESAQAEADKRLSAANAEAEKIISDAERLAKQISETAAEEAQRKAELAAAAGDSAAQLKTRDETLRIKQELIEGVLNDVPGRLCSMPDAEYFDFLYSLLKRSGETEGTLYLGKNDLKRDISEIKKRIADTDIKIGNDAADIENGFILKNGGIEINASFSALLREKHGELVDAVNKIMFERE